MQDLLAAAGVEDRDLLDAGVQSDRSERDERWTRTLREELESANVEVGVTLTEASLTLRELLEMQPGDVAETCADVDDLMRDIGFRPKTPIEEGIRRFAAWFRDYHRA